MPVSLSRISFSLSRVRIKAVGLFGRGGLAPKESSSTAILLSQCPDCERLEHRLVEIEGKLDLLIEGLLGGMAPPGWLKEAEGKLLTAIGEVTGECRHISSDRDRLEGDLREMADGADRFLAGLRKKLTKEQAELFFELIASVENGEGRRVQTYSEIGKRLGISKQAVQQRLRRMAEMNPSVADYIKAIRHPEKPRLFSEMSPRERRATGVDGSYDYHQKD